MISNEVTFGEKFFTKFLQPTVVTCRHYSSTSTYSRKLAVSGIVTTDTIKASAVKLKLLEVPLRCTCLYKIGRRWQIGRSRVTGHC